MHRVPGWPDAACDSSWLLPRGLSISVGTHRSRKPRRIGCQSDSLAGRRRGRALGDGRRVLVPSGSAEVPLPRYPQSGQGPATQRRPRSGWVSIGRLSAEKGHAGLSGQWPEGEQLKIIGDGPERPTLEASASHSVSFAGVVDPAGLAQELSSAEGLLAQHRARGCRHECGDRVVLCGDASARAGGDCCGAVRRSTRRWGRLCPAGVFAGCARRCAWRLDRDFRFSKGELRA